MNLKKLGSVFYKAGYHTVEHDGIEHAGYLAFLGLLSIFPFLVFIFSVASSLGRQEIGAEFIGEFSAILPEDVALALTPRINEILTGPPQGLLTIAIIGMVWTASSAVEGLRTILNKIYHVTNPPVYVYRRLMSMVQFVILAFAVVVAMFFLTFAPTIWDSLQELTNFQFYIDADWAISRYIFSVGILFLSVSASYYILPNIKQSWRAVMTGALMVVLLWVTVAYIFSSYLHYYKQFNVVYGSLAGIIISLIFFYVLGVIYIFGAEFNYFYEKARGHKIVEKAPDKPTVIDKKLLPSTTKNIEFKLNKSKKKRKRIKSKMVKKKR